MAKRILQINFRPPENMDMESREARQTAQEWAEEVAEFSGLSWKIWLKNEETREYGGIYLFEDEQSLERYLEGKTATEIGKMPEHSFKQFEILEDLTEKTDGPVN